jgi:hypothetical protein
VWVHFPHKHPSGIKDKKKRRRSSVAPFFFFPLSLEGRVEYGKQVRAHSHAHTNKQNGREGERISLNAHGGSQKIERLSTVDTANTIAYFLPCLASAILRSWLEHASLAADSAKKKHT